MGSNRMRAASRLLPAILFLLVSASLPAATWAQGALDAVAFVKQRFIHGVPYDEARQLPRSAVPALVVMLGDPANEPYLMTIVITLGVIGDSRATQPIIDLAERSTGEISLDRFNALLSVPTALGHLARQGDAQALAYLVDKTSPSRWRASGARWSFGRYRGDARDVLLTKVTVNGLAASGRTEALTKLRQLRDAPESAPLAAALDSNVSEGLGFNARVRQEGADHVFGRSAGEGQ